MATNYGRSFASARALAMQDGTPEGILEARIRKFESLFGLNPNIAEQLENVGLFAPACTRIALGAKFDATEVDYRLEHTADLTHQQKIGGKLVLMDIGLLD